MKKIVKKIIIVIVIFVIVIGTIGFYYINKMINPEVVVSGNGEQKVLCIGDSITFGQGVLMKREKEAFSAILSEKLGENYQVLNYGLCNRTLLSTGDFPYVEEDFAKESLEQDADIVIIMLGTNDSKPDNWNAEKYEEEYIEFVKSYQNMSSSPKVYVMLPPCIFSKPESTGDCNNEILVGEVLPAIERVAQATGAVIIDLYSVTEGHSDWYADGLHPNTEGNKAIAEEIYQTISK